MSKKQLPSDIITIGITLPNDSKKQAAGRPLGIKKVALRILPLTLVIFVLTMAAGYGLGQYRKKVGRYIYDINFLVRERHMPFIHTTHNTASVLSRVRAKPTASGAQTTLGTTPSNQVPNDRFGIATGSSVLDMNSTELDRYFGGLQQLGVGWVRWDLSWPLVQHGGKDSYDWAKADQIVSAANRYDIKSLPILTYTPTWARAQGCNSEACAPADNSAFAHFAAAVAQRYAPRGIHHYEIWNEPNSVQFWQPMPNTDNYANLLEKTYMQIKKVDPSATVLTGGLAPIDTASGNISPEDFIKSIYENGAINFSDAVALHPYAYPQKASSPYAWSGWQQMLRIHSYMQSQNNIKKIWVTEYGVPTDGPGKVRSSLDVSFTSLKDYMSEASQAEHVADAGQAFMVSSDWIQVFFLYSYQDLSTQKTTSENFFGITRSDGTQKPAYQAYKNLIAKQF